MLNYQEIVDWFKGRGYHVEEYAKEHPIHLFHANAWKPYYESHRVLFQIYKDRKVAGNQLNASVVGELHMTLPEDTDMKCTIHHMDSQTTETLAAAVDLACYRFQIIKNNIPRIPRK